MKKVKCSAGKLNCIKGDKSANLKISVFSALKSSSYSSEAVFFSYWFVFMYVLFKKNEPYTNV